MRHRCMYVFYVCRSPCNGSTYELHYPLAFKLHNSITQLATQPFPPLHPYIYTSTPPQQAKPSTCPTLLSSTHISPSLKSNSATKTCPHRSSNSRNYKLVHDTIRDNSRMGKVACVYTGTKQDAYNLIFLVLIIPTR